MSLGAPALLLDYWTLSKTTSDEAFDVVFDAVPALLLYY